MSPKTLRFGLWALLVVLMGALLGSLVWLVGRYEQSRYENQLDISARDLAHDISAKLVRNAQRLNVLLDSETPNWSWTARQLLEEHPEIFRVERRDATLRIETSANSLYLRQASTNGVFYILGRQNFQSEVTAACALAARSQEATYSVSYFIPQSNGIGYEVTDMCLPRIENKHVTGYLVVTYSLNGILKEWGEAATRQNQEVSFVAADGSRLAVMGKVTRSGHRVTAKTLLNLQGITLLLRLEIWRSAPYWLANTPTALVLLLVTALTGVLWLLYRDTRKRLRAEASLAKEIIQQRKAEEMSRQSLERLQKSARLATLGEMASMLSHEINQPLAAIASYASGGLNVLATDADNAQIKVALERIAAQSERAGLIIKSVHDFVRRREAQHSAVAPQTLLGDVLPLLGLLAKQMDIALDLQVAPHLPPVWCDKTLVEQVIINLARNGMQAMGVQAAKAPSLDASLRVLTLKAHQDATSDGKYVAFDVHDQGSGLTQDVQDKLFTPFFTTKTEGMGLGLSLCRTVIEQHGSSLTYTTQTQAPHTGTTFSFKLMTAHAILT